MYDIILIGKMEVKNDLRMINVFIMILLYRRGKKIGKLCFIMLFLFIRRGILINVLIN